MSAQMSDPPPSDVLGALPNTRPHRRSDKRATKPAATTAPVVDATPPATAPAAAKATAKPASARARKPAARKPAKAKAKRATMPPAEGTVRAAPTPFYPPAGAGRVAAQKATKPAADEKFDVLGTAIQAAAELAEIGISATARAIRGAVDRLPRP